jgi:type II secretory pathway component GspD/PulD (secretin)
MNIIDIIRRAELTFVAAAAFAISLSGASAAEYELAGDLLFDSFASLPALAQAEIEQSESAVGQIAEEELVEVVPAEEEELTLRPPLQAGGGQSNLVTISLDGATVNDVIKMFTRISGANIISSVESDAKVTVSMYDVPWREALSSVLESVDLSLVEKSPNVFTILSKEDLASEPLLVDSYQLKFLTTAEVVTVAQRMLTATNGVAHAAPGNIIILKETRDQISRIKETLASIDKPVPQVFIEAKFVEMNEQAIKDLGINWQSLQGYTINAGNLQWGYQNQNETVEGRADLDRRWDRRSNVDTLSNLYDMNGLQYEEKETTFLESPPDSGNFVANSDLMPTRSITDVIDRGREVTSDLTRDVTETITEARSAILSADQFSLTLSALQQNDGVHIVSNPKIIVASSETATIHVGQKDPELRAVADNNLGGRLSYERRDWIESGVRLEVTPVVNTEDIITLVIKPELSRVIGKAESGDINITIPILSTREIMTKFNVKSGQTAAIGGLTQTRNEDRISKIPLLGDIPIIGKYLFSHTHKERVQDEVVIFVTVDLAPPESILEREGLPSDAMLARDYLLKAARAKDAE